MILFSLKNAIKPEDFKKKGTNRNDYFSISCRFKHYNTSEGSIGLAVSFNQTLFAFDLCIDLLILQFLFHFDKVAFKYSRLGEAYSEYQLKRYLRKRSIKDLEEDLEWWKGRDHLQCTESEAGLRLLKEELKKRNGKKK